MNVLIVDDNADVRRVIRHVIADVASEIHECASGAEGLFLFGAHRPDWVLMDIQMPGGDGLDITRHITAYWPRMRICIVTSHDDAELRAAAMRAGAREYVVKDDLLALRTILRR